MIGLGVFDCLARDIQDPDTGEVYPALSCCNSSEMAARCTSQDADRVIWSVKASAQFNSDCAVLLREGFRSGRVRLLINEFEAENELSEIKGYNGLNPQERLKLQLPYIHTTLLIDELVKLQHEESGGKIRIYEKSGMRKDRYSSLAYNYYVATQLEAKAVRKNNVADSLSDAFIVKAPHYDRRAVSKSYGGNNAPGWS